MRGLGMYKPKKNEIFHFKELKNGKLVKNPYPFYLCHKCQSNVIWETCDTAPYCFKCSYLLNKQWNAAGEQILENYKKGCPIAIEGVIIFKTMMWQSVFLSILKTDALNKTPKTSIVLEDLHSPYWIEKFQKWKKHPVWSHPLKKTALYGCWYKCK